MQKITIWFRFTPGSLVNPVVYENVDTLSFDTNAHVLVVRGEGWVVTYPLDVVFSTTAEMLEEPF